MHYDANLMGVLSFNTEKFVDVHCIYASNYVALLYPYLNDVAFAIEQTILLKC